MTITTPVETRCHFCGGDAKVIVRSRLVCFWCRLDDVQGKRRGTSYAKALDERHAMLNRERGD